MDDGTQVFCFLDMNRPCSGDCVAYHVPTEESPYLSAEQMRCVLLRSLEQSGRGAVVLAGAVRSEISNRKNREADAARQAATPRPPIPGGT